MGEDVLYFMIIQSSDWKKKTYTGGQKKETELQTDKTEQTSRHPWWLLTILQPTLGRLGGKKPVVKLKNNFNVRKRSRNETHLSNMRQFSLCANLDSLSAFISSVASS